jgi:sigma-B regulation protein RsbU (phosphoserine phosphatase)
LSDHAPQSPDAEDLTDLYENAPCGYLSVSPEGRIVRANATVARWLNYPQESLSGMRLSDIMSIGGRMYWETHLGPLLRMQGFIDGVALDLLTAESQKLPAFGSAIECRDSSGQLIVTRLTMFKGAERRHYERSLVTARMNVEQAMNDLQTHDRMIQESLRLERETSELREQFIAILGHDLRNPLSAINSGVHLLAKESLSETSAQILSLMHGSVQRMSGLIDNVLDFAKGRLGGGLSLACNAREPLEPVLLQVVEELRAITPDRRIETSIAITEPIYCDHSRIGQLVSNLLSNAISHGSAEKPVRLFATTDGSLVISVTNGGKPIAAATMDKLFQPFFRGEVRPSRKGVGLGLYIASEIAKAHGGTLTAASSAEETRFTFRMPLVLLS